MWDNSFTHFIRSLVAEFQIEENTNFPSANPAQSRLYLNNCFSIEQNDYEV